MTRAERERGAVWQQLAGRTVGDGLTDAELVRRLAADCREAAFAALVHRHGPLVLGVCRRILGDHHAAEDAFQATFLVLWRKAPDVASLAGWLHGVAVRVARKALTRASRSRARERKVETMPPTPPADEHLDDLRPVLDEEIARLSSDYRAALALCYFEGKTYQEAGRILGWPEGTVSGRLSRARELLRERLTRRGVTCSAAGIATLLATLPATAVPPALEAATLALVGEAVVPPAVASLAAVSGASRRIVGVVLASLMAAGVGVAVVGLSTPPTPVPDAKTLPPDEVRFRHPAAVVAVAVSPRGDWFATAGADEGVQLWTPEGNLARRLPAHRGGVTAVAFAPDGRSLATAAHDGVTRVWSLADESVHALPAHEDAASAIAFSPGGKLLASGGWDGRVRLGNVAERTETQLIAAHRGKCWGVAFSPDGKVIATLGDKELRLWNATTGRSIRRLDAFRGPGYAVAFTDPKHLAVSRDNTVSLVRATTGEEVARVGGPQVAVATFAVSPDGRTIAWAGGDRTVHLWEVATRQERLTLTLGEDVTALAFAADGSRLLTGGAGGQVVARRLSRLAPPLDPTRFAAAWADLTGSDAAKAYRAVRSFADSPDAAVPFLAEKVPSGPGFEARLGKLIADLDAPAFTDREAAVRELRTLGPLAADALRKAVAETASVEVRERAESLVARLPDADTLPPTLARVLEVLELTASPSARDALRSMADARPETELGRQAALALDRLGHKPSNGDDR